MDCDIHLFVEVRKDGKWESIHEFESETCDNGHVWHRAVDEWYIGRNYRLFAILANVRNGHGFAGIDTGDALVPISQPKGFPADAAPEHAQISDSWGVDGHSHSYLTLRELLEYDWTRQIENRGVVGAVEYWRWTRWDREQGEGPEHWSDDVSGHGVVYISESELSASLSKIGTISSSYKAKQDEIARLYPNTYVRVYWKQPYYKMVRHFLSDVMPQLWRLGSPDDVRIVFFFDN